MAKTFVAIGLGCVVALGCTPRERRPAPLQPQSSLQPAPTATEPHDAAPATAPTAPAPEPVAEVRPAPVSDEVIATVRGRPIHFGQLRKPLVEAHGLNLLLNLVQLELARQELQQVGGAVSPEDVKAEYDFTFAGMFENADKADWPVLFEQFIQNQRISKPEFDLVMQTNAHLRKLAEPMTRGRITEDNLQEAFRTLYGENVQVRHIACQNMQEVAEVKRRLAAGEAFEQVARELSRNQRTASLGGELPPFSRNTPNLAQPFKDAAFGLKVGEVSDPVQADGFYHLIKLERRIAPKVIKFEDVKNSIREDLEKRLLMATVKQLRTDLAREAMESLKIVDPVLRQQWDDRVNQRDQQIKERDQIRQQFERERAKILERHERQAAPDAPETVPGTAPTTAPATAPAAVPPAAVPGAAIPAAPGTQPVRQPEGLRPPATQPAAAAPAGTPSSLPATLPDLNK